MQVMPPPAPHVPLMNVLIAQFVTLFRNTRELGHVCEPQSAMQPKSNIGMPPPPVKSKQPKRQVSASAQLWSMHAPQSTAQLEHVSNADISQRMLPQNAHEPQSAEQLAQVSGARQWPSPHEGQLPQSAGHVKQSSPEPAAHMPSPHVTQAPQSGAHVVQVSPSEGSQKPFRHELQMPQSCGQLEQFSEGWHARSPQSVQMPQSCEHVAQLSVA